MNVPSIKAELRSLIERSLTLSYMSVSGSEKIKTGNHYQSVRLGEDQTVGFRTDRQEFLNQIDFGGKDVLDLGSNLGEISRLARSRGAHFVDGFEYDPYFIEVANLINAYNEVTRVSFFHRDITDASIFDEQYDIVLAFSVYQYIGSVMDRIAGITKQVFVLETHKLEGNLESHYLNPISRYFPHYRILGESDWGKTFDASEKRAVIVFAREQTILDALTCAREQTSGTKFTEAAQGSSKMVDVPTFHSATPLHMSTTPETSIAIDMQRTKLHQRFFSMFQFDTAEDLLTAISKLDLDLESIAQSHDAKALVYSGWVYWLIYTKGYLQYAETGTIGKGNMLLDYLLNYYLPRNQDPGLRALADPLKAITRVAYRFQDFDVFRNTLARNPGEINSVNPVTVFLEEPPVNGRLLVYEIGSDVPIQATLVDGWHRLFLASLFGVGTLRGKIAKRRADRQRLETSETEGTTT
jgi:SAM-dependent methyltransferase